MTLLVSACLLHLPTRWDATAANVDLRHLAQKHTLIPVCPEQLGGLPTPRPPCELRGGRAVSRDGRDYTEEYLLGARLALEIFKTSRCGAAVLKLRSPSCGKGFVYDGTFTRALVPGDGLFAGLLVRSGVPVFCENQMDELGA